MAIKDKIPKLLTFPDASTSQDINNVMLNHFFPLQANLIPSSNPLWFPNSPLISPNEVSKALAASFNNSAPGPNTFPYLVWKQVHCVNPFLILSLLSSLLQTGYHPKALKHDFGVVLSKPNKPDYNSPAVYRIIVLLETVSKILEHIVTYCLTTHTRASGLIHPHQCSSIIDLSTAHTATTLMYEIWLL